MKKLIKFRKKYRTLSTIIIITLFPIWFPLFVALFFGVFIWDTANEAIDDILD